MHHLTKSLHGNFKSLFLNGKNQLLHIRKMIHVQQFQEKLGLSNGCNSIGQPSPFTHPHLLKPSELVPGFTLKDFANRREQLAEVIYNTNPKCSHLVLIPSSSIQYMTEKIPYVFRQNSDFRYLTGCLEPDSAILLHVKPDRNFSSTLFVRPKNAHQEMWEGPRTGVDAAVDTFGTDEAKSFDNIDKVLSDEVAKMEKSYTFWYESRNPTHSSVHKAVIKFLSDSNVKQMTSKIESVREKVHELRLIKSKEEQELMLQSAKIASEAIASTIANTTPGQTEHELFASVDYYCRIKGAEYLAYPPVVASGNNANIIHYINNNQQICDGDLILMDAGCEFHGYSSDITRTWPANGKFSPTQQTVYEIVLDIQSELIKTCSSEDTLESLYSKMCSLLGKHLREAHILSKEGAALKDEVVSYKLCPHHVGHYLGMDVHDVGTVNRKKSLQDGIIITIEPGIYINQKSTLTKPEFRGIGIRIEDDILFKNGKAQVLSSCPKTVKEIEELCESN